MLFSVIVVFVYYDVFVICIILCDFLWRIELTYIYLTHSKNFIANILSKFCVNWFKSNSKLKE